jgi:hypothetical protein
LALSRDEVNAPLRPFYLQKRDPLPIVLEGVGPKAALEELEKFGLHRI